MFCTILCGKIALRTKSPRILGRGDYEKVVAQEETKMIIGDKKLEALKKMPVIETAVFKSKDGKYIVNKTTITDIKPVNYFQAVIDNDPKE